MSSIVLDLQKELIKSDCDVLSALRRAQIIATKLNLVDFDTWIKQELNGYKLGDNIPEYRKISGMLKAFNPRRGWIPAIVPNNELEKKFCIQDIAQPISELVQLSKSGNASFEISFSGEHQVLLNRLFNNYVDTEFKIFIGQNNIIGIIEAVNNCLLEWTLKLEEQGILGEDMKFTVEETQSAKGISQQINNYYGNFVNGDVSGSQFAGDNSPITITYNNGIDTDEFEKLAKAIIDNVSLLDDENKETVLGAIEILREEITKAQPKKSILNSGIKLLAPIFTIANGIPTLANNIQKLIDFVCQLPPMLP